MLRQVQKLKRYTLKPFEQLTLEPFERDVAVVTGTYAGTAEDRAKASMSEPRVAWMEVVARGILRAK
jgi:hypothetical protein